MKTYFLFFLLIMGFISAGKAQSAIYKCLAYEYKDEKEPSNNKVITDPVFVSVGQSEVKLFMNQDAQKPEDVEMKWNIVSKVEETPTATQGLRKTTYTVRREVNGVEEQELLYMYKTEDATVKTLDITIYDPKQKTSWIFNSLIRE